MLQNDISSLDFTITNNVYIDVINKKSGEVKQHVEKHNKATRRMVSGILRFLSAHFNSTYKSDSHQYTNAKDYIPCFASFGDGNIQLTRSIGSDIYYPQSSATDPRIPVEVNPDWASITDYDSKEFLREFKLASRTEIRKVTDSLEYETTADMDSIYFEIELAPDVLNQTYNDHAVFVSELGLFANNVPYEADMLAYVKLGNYTEDDVEKTNVLYVKPSDTVLVKWIITIAAVGIDNTYRSQVEGMDDIQTSIVVPEIQVVDIEEL